MMIYVNILKNRWIYVNILVIYQNIKVKQIQDFHRSVIDFNMSTFHWASTPMAASASFISKANIT